MADADLAPGRWRCLLCNPPSAWEPGTLQDYLRHYYTAHQEEEK